MTVPKRIAAFYSLGPHYLRVLEHLRRAYPDAALSAWIPTHVPADEVTRAGADDINVTERPHFSPADVGACIRLLRGLRAQRYDVFAVMFDSPQLRALTALSGARTRVYITPRGHSVALPESLAGVLVRLMARGLWGRLVYAGIWFSVRFTRAGAEDQ